MRGKWFAAGLLAAATVLAWVGPSGAGDTIRLNLTDDAAAQNLVDDGSGADTILAWHHGFGHRGFGYGGFGYRGLGWGGYRGFGYGGLGLGYRGFGYGGLGLGYRGFGYGGLGLGYRGFGYGGFYRPYYGFGLGGLGMGYRGFGFGGYGLGGLGYGIGYGGFYPGFGLGYGGMFGPCAGAAAGVYTLNLPLASFDAPLPGAFQPGPGDVAPMPPADGTFPYDGGPANPVPVPQPTTKPSAPQKRDLPLEGRSVSLPKAAPKWTYPAYGETARRTTPTADRVYLTRGDAKKPAH